MSARSDRAGIAGRSWRRGLVYLPVALAYLFIVALLVAPPAHWLPADGIAAGLQVTAASAGK